MTTPMISREPAYSHTQPGPWHWLFDAIGLACVGIACFLNRVPDYYVVASFGVFWFLLAASFHSLTIEDRGDMLAVYFGPLPLFRRTIRYADMVRVAQKRSTVLDGWGMHWSPWKGWLWNIWGRDCVAITLAGGQVRLGTDEPVVLADFLESKLSTRGD